MKKGFNSTTYEKLRYFFEKIWMGKEEYKVIISQRCFNLNFFFIDKLEAETDRKSRDYISYAHEFLNRRLGLERI